MSLHDDLVRHWSENDTLMETYWNNSDLIDGSKKLAKKISALKPKSVFEVGMYNGRNLKYIHQLMPDIKIAGCDVNETALKFAISNLPQEIGVYHGDALYLDTSEKFDVVFTHGVLMHISMGTVSQVIDNCINKANKYIVHIERKEQDNAIIRGPEETNAPIVDDQLRWAPNIVGMYQSKGLRVQTNKITYFGQRKKVSFIIISKE